MNTVQTGRSRPADTQLTVQLEVRELHACDSLIATDGGAELYVARVKKLGAGIFELEVWRDGSKLYMLGGAKVVTARAEFSCDCGGSGIYYWGGSVNGRPARSGTHFACAGKGYQDRSDTIRNSTYWNKYARISY